MRHHSFGIYECKEKFGTVITNSDGRKIAVRWIGEQHVQEDCGFIPSVKDWFDCIKTKPWMHKTRPLSKEL